LSGIVRSITGIAEATRSKPMLYQLLSMAVLEASESLVQAGFKPERLHELGVADEVAYFVEAKYRGGGAADDGTAPPSPGTPYLRLIGA
jgi:hypothetical protein